MNNCDDCVNMRYPTLNPPYCKLDQNEYTGQIVYSNQYNRNLFGRCKHFKKRVLWEVWIICGVLVATIIIAIM